MLINIYKISNFPIIIRANKTIQKTIMKNIFFNKLSTFFNNVKIIGNAIKIKAFH